MVRSKTPVLRLATEILSERATNVIDVGARTAGAEEHYDDAFFAHHKEKLLVLLALLEAYGDDDSVSAGLKRAVSAGIVPASLAANVLKPFGLARKDEPNPRVWSSQSVSFRIPASRR